MHQTSLWLSLAFPRTAICASNPLPRLCACRGLLPAAAALATWSPQPPPADCSPDALLAECLHTTAGCRAVCTLLGLSLLAGPGTLESRTAFRLVSSARLALAPAADVMAAHHAITTSMPLGSQERRTSAGFMLMLCSEALEAAAGAVQAVPQVEAQASAALRGSLCRPEHLADLSCRATACLELCVRVLGLGEP